MDPEKQPMVQEIQTQTVSVPLAATSKVNGESNTQRIQEKVAQAGVERCVLRSDE